MIIGGLLMMGSNISSNARENEQGCHRRWNGICAVYELPITWSHRSNILPEAKVCTIREDALKASKNTTNKDSNDPGGREHSG